MTNPTWLPEVLVYSNFKGDWDKFLTSVYEIFERDFKKSRPTYQGLPVGYDSRIEDGKEAVFWHLICRDDFNTQQRELDLRRCERIPWLKPIINHSTDLAISVWKNKRHGKTRVLIWLEALDYIIVMAEKSKVMILVTAYCTDIKSHKEKLMRDREEYNKMQKPPESGLSTPSTHGR
jgi:hypothetical protein